MTYTSFIEICREKENQKTTTKRNKAMGGEYLACFAVVPKKRRILMSQSLSKREHTFCLATANYIKKFTNFHLKSSSSSSESSGCGSATGWRNNSPLKRL